MIVPFLFNTDRGSLFFYWVIYNRAELADELFLPVEDIVLENFVIIKENKDFKLEV